MKNIKVRELNPSDIAKLSALFRTRDELDEEGAENRVRLFEWLAFSNPFADGEATYFVAEDGGKIVGHLGRMPTQIIINGKVRKAYFVHDLYVHPEYRKKGMGFFVTMSLYKATEDNSKSFCCLVWTTELNLEIQRRRGYNEQWADRYVKILNPHEKLGKTIRQKLLAKLLSLSLRKSIILTDSVLFTLLPSKMQIRQIERFDSRFDHFIKKVLHKIGTCPFKTSSYLNWKFIDRPFRKTEVFAAEEKGEVFGFVVVVVREEKGYPQGTIVDIMADPEDSKTISSLCRAAIDYFKKQNVHSIDCCLTDKRFLKIVKKFLFLKAFGKEPVMLANLSKSEDKEYLADITNWHLTYGHSDRFMLI